MVGSFSTRTMRLKAWMRSLGVAMPAPSSTASGSCFVSRQSPGDIATRRGSQRSFKEGERSPEWYRPVDRPSRSRQRTPPNLQSHRRPSSACASVDSSNAAATALGSVCRAVSCRPASDIAVATRLIARAIFCAASACCAPAIASRKYLLRGGHLTVRGISRANLPQGACYEVPVLLFASDAVGISKKAVGLTRIGRRQTRALQRPRGRPPDST